MKIGYFIRNIGVSGGVKIMLQHVKLLRSMGYDAILITEKIKKDWYLETEPFIVKDEKLNDIPDCDLYVGSAYNDVKRLYSIKKNRVIHYCQGFEPAEYSLRVKGKFLSEKYDRKGLFSSVARFINNIKFRKKIKKIESIYALPTIKAGVSPHLVRLIKERFGQECSLIHGGIDKNIFHARNRKPWMEGGELKILSVGSMFVGLKGIDDTYEAIKTLKKRGLKIKFIRVSPSPATKKEMEDGIVDKYFVGLSEVEMADLYRQVDIYISTSLPGEGLGLPALEALASGVPSILTEIPSYMELDEKKDFVCFVPIHSPDAVATGVMRILEDDNFRNKCIQRGLEVAEKYTLERTKEDLQKFFRLMENRILR